MYTQIFFNESHRTSNSWPLDLAQTCIITPLMTFAVEERTQSAPWALDGFQGPILLSRTLLSASACGPCFESPRLVRRG